MIWPWRRVILRHVVASSIVAIPVARGTAQATQTWDAHRSRLDLYVDRHRVSAALGDWSSIGLRLVAPVSSGGTVWYADAFWRRAFGDEGAYVALGAQQTLGRDWYAFLSGGFGTGDFVLPDARYDASLSRKWLPGRSLVTTAGVTVVDAKRGYRDAAGFVALAVYPTAGVVAELGERINRSSPGDVTSQRTFGAITLGNDRRRYVVLRGSSGTEGYQLLGPSIAIHKFTSQEASASWREWLGHNWGAFAQGEHYRNALYRRTGVTLGVFIHW